MNEVTRWHEQEQVHPKNCSKTIVNPKDKKILQLPYAPLILQHHHPIQAVSNTVELKATVLIEQSVEMRHKTPEKMSRFYKL